MKNYNEEKYYRMIRNKQLIYTNQLKRLSKSGKRANFVIIYYSMSLIIFTLSAKYFCGLLNVNTTEYFSIILSIVILIYSIINSNSRYSERVQAVEYAMNEIKRLKRKLGNLSRLDQTAQKAEFDEIREDYEELVESVEYRDDLDFYRTVCYLCKQFGIDCKTGEDIDTTCDLKSFHLTQDEIDSFKDEIRGYIIEISPRIQKFNISLLFIWHIILYSLPVLLFILCHIVA